MEYTKSNNTYFATPKDDLNDRINIEVGDSKQPDFKPQVKMMRWDNEVNFSARLIDDEITKPSITTEGNKIIWDNTKKEINFYNIDPCEELLDGGYEFEVILKEKPTTNKIEFTINTKGVDFVYQPFLKDELPKNLIVKSRILDLISEQQFSSIVDIGGGTGFFVSNFNGTCIDLSEDAFLKRKTEAYVKGDITKGISGVSDKQFDLAIGIGLLKYIKEEDVERTIVEISRISNKGIFFTGNGFETFSDTPLIVNEHNSAWWTEKFNKIVPDYKISVFDLAPIERPKNVEGSYAIYTSDKKVNYVGGKKYKTGKVGHIYRPRVIDAVGTEAWSELNIDTEKSILTVTIPQEFLDSAVYPVRHAAGLTIGNTSAGASSDYFNDYIHAIYENSVNGTATDMNISMHVSFDISTSMKAKTAVYQQDITGTAFVRGTTEQEWTSNLSKQWVTFTFTPNNPTLTTGEDHYYLAVWGDIVGSAYNDELRVYYDAGSGRTVTRAYGDWPSTWPSDYAGYGYYSIYATYGAGSTTYTQNNSTKASIVVTNNKDNSAKANIFTGSSVSNSAKANIVADWYNYSWQYRVKITVLASKVDADLTDYPIYVDLSSLPAGFHTNVNQTDARDIRVTTSDGATEVPREVVFYDAATNTGKMFFKGDVDGDTDTDFYIYYGNSGATEPAKNADFGAGNTWNSNYLAVFHLQETANTDADGYKDSTNNNNHGDGNSMSSASVDGKLAGKCAVFDGADDYIKNIPKLISNNTWTVSAYAYFHTFNESSAGDPIFSQGVSAATGAIQAGGLDGSSPYTKTLFGRNGGAGLGLSEINVVPSVDTWYYVTITFNNTVYIPYVNGVAKTGNSSLTGGTPENATCNLATWYDKSASRCLEGRLQEVRIRDDIATATWISTEQSNLNSPSTFYSVGEIEEGIVGSNSSTKANIVVTNSSNNNTKSNVVTVSNNNNSSKASVVVFNSNNNSSKADIINTYQTNNFTKSSILVTNNISQDSKSNIIVIQQAENNTKSNILVSAEYSLDSDVKGNVIGWGDWSDIWSVNVLPSSVTHTVDNATKASIVVTNVLDNSAKSDIVSTNLSVSHALANILSEISDGSSVKANILSIGSYPLYTKSNILQTVFKDISTKANVLNTYSNNNETKASIVFIQSFNLYSKANIFRTNEIQENDAKSDILRVNESYSNNTKASIVVENIFNSTTKTNILGTLLKNNSTIASIVVVSQFPSYSKANILRVNEISNNNVKSNIVVLGNLVHNETRADILTTYTYDTSSKANILSEYQLNNSSLTNIIRIGELNVNYVKSSIVVTNNIDNVTKADISRTDEKISNFTKVSILRTKSDENIVKVNILAVGQVENSVKSNTLVADVLNENFSKASIVRTESFDNSVEANILTTENINNEIIANILTVSSFENNVKTSIRIMPTHDNTAKANIIVSNSLENLVKSNILYPYHNSVRASIYSSRIYKPRPEYTKESPIYVPRVEPFSRKHDFMADRVDPYRKRSDPYTDKL